MKSIKDYIIAESGTRIKDAKELFELIKKACKYKVEENSTDNKNGMIFCSAFITIDNEYYVFNIWSKHNYDFEYIVFKRKDSQRALAYGDINNLEDINEIIEDVKKNDD